eukprot:TRINITY_DN61576_c0_g1_i1.p1 TRINITY_DN61576_c0_g1~~TRINITY_DN61576_c0_g1_i1.p1  ORF type:complete len:217 (+),score=17.04 TRINITY_DN61576_c0_g1_i1:2-652(+)
MAICVAERLTLRNRPATTASTRKTSHYTPSEVDEDHMVPLPAGISASPCSANPTTNEEAATRLLLFAHQLHGIKFKLGGKRVVFRTGMHAGPIVAGVIGLNRFSFDLWGDTVNMASRMESTGIPGAIQVTSEFKQLICSGEFPFEPRHGVTVKGKGVIDTYLLIPTTKRSRAMATSDPLLLTQPVLQQQESDRHERATVSNIVGDPELGETHNAWE